MSDQEMVSADEAREMLSAAARGRDEGNGGDVWPLYGRAEDLARTVLALHKRIAAMEVERAAAVAEEQARCVSRVRDLASDWEWKGEPDVIVALEDLVEKIEQGVRS